jgi:hypothetical protein
MDNEIPLAELRPSSSRTTPTELGGYADLIAELRP